MQQIADWLEKLGMSEYTQRFAENRIDFSVLGINEAKLPGHDCTASDAFNVSPMLARMPKHQSTSSRITSALMM